MMNVLFLTLGSFSDISEKGIYTDLMREFVRNGHTVYIVMPVERRFHRPTEFNEDGNVRILRVRTLNIQKTNLIEKGISTLLIEHLFIRAIRKYIGMVKFDLILYSTPPITFTKVIRLFKRRDKAITYLLLKDIFPQNAVDIGLLSKKSPLYWMFRRTEKRLYRLSDYIGCMSPANMEYVLRHNPFILKDRVGLNPNSIEIGDDIPVTNKKKIREKYGLPTDVSVFIYGGNLGKPQGIGFLLRTLEANMNREDCFFLIVGSGTEYGKIHDWFKVNKPSNAKLMRGLPRAEYNSLVRSCDVGLIFLDPRFTIPNYPSRLLSYLENKMPVLLATDRNTDIGRIAVENGYGLWCESGDIESYSRCLTIFLEKGNIREMGRKGYDFLIKNYLVAQSYQKIMEHSVLTDKQGV